MTWETIMPRAGVRSQSGGVTCAWRSKQRRLAITLSAEVCRTLGIQSGVKEPVTAQMDRVTGRLRLVIGCAGQWAPRPKDGCMSIHLPLDHVTDALPAKPAQTVAYEVDAEARAVVMTLPGWAVPASVAAARAAAGAVRRVA